MRIKRIAGALFISVVFHLLVVSFIGIRFLYQELYQCIEVPACEFCIALEPPKPKLRNFTVNTLKEFEIYSILQAGVSTNPTNSNSVNANIPTQKTSTTAINEHLYNSQNVSPIADLTNIAPSKIQRQLSTVNIKDLSVEEVRTVRSALPYVVEDIRIGHVEVPPFEQGLGQTPKRGGRIRVNQLPKGEPGGIVIGHVSVPITYAGVPTTLNPPNGAGYDAVFFKNAGTNPFIDTEDDNFSTFGMDVDTASYTVTRRFISDAILPPTDAVRVEEFVNTFDYNYDPPAEEAFAVHIEGAPSKFGEGKRLQLLHVGIQGRVIPDNNRKDAILTFVVDISGSMQRENRLELVKKALALLLNQLREGDKVGIGVYGSNAHVLLPHTGIENREFILDAINRLTSSGSTNAEAGLRVGYKLALKNSKTDCINRVILCSDGVANVGRTGPNAILKEIDMYVKEGVALTTVGFGMGNYNDVLMEQLANKGNGSYTYVDTLQEARRVFVENLTGTLQIIAKDAKIQVEFNPETVSRFRLLGYENRSLANEDFRKDDVDAGEVGSGDSVTALYEIKLHENADGELATVFIRHEDPDSQKVTEVNETISTDQLKQTFEQASVEYQLVAAVAEFAEILKESYWAKEGSLAAVEETIENMLPHIHSKTPEEKQRKEELLGIVRRARQLKEQNEG